MNATATQVKPIEDPEASYDKPAGYCKGMKRLRGGISSGWGLPIELFELADGTVCLVDRQVAHMPRYSIFSSLRAWEIYDRRHATRDPEAHGGRFFPSDYVRLKISQRDVRDTSGVSVTGWRHAPACRCTACSSLVSYHETKYAHSEEAGYLPFCQECYPYE
ncbi:MAG: hypothetical protein ACXAC5_02255 [Promethearchaeota archaeon]|jgi:hypothetical protein